MAWDRQFRAWASLALVLAIGSCSDDPEEPTADESRGELGFAIFEWDCVSGSDAMCDTTSFPRFVANGSEFAATFHAVNVPPEVTEAGIESASPNIINDDLGVMRADRPGIVALLAIGGGDSVIDYVNVLVLDVDRIAIRAAEQQPSCADFECVDVVGEGGAFILVPGQSVNVIPQPFSHGQLVGGALQYEWESLTPDTLQVSNGIAGEATLTPVAVGDATLLVSGGGITQTLQLHVIDTPSPFDDSTTGGPGGTGGTDTGSGPGTGSGGDTGTGTDTGPGTGGATGTGTGGTGTGTTGGV